MDVVAFIPARGGSKSIPDKNIKLIAGRPLLHWAASAALQCESIDRVFVASDSEAIRRVAADLQSAKLTIQDRDPETCTDTASTESALLEFAKDRLFEWVVLIQPTSPLITSKDLRDALKALLSSDATSLVSVTRQHSFRWTLGANGRVAPANYNPLNRPRRQDWPGELHENGAFYITRRNALLETGCRLSGPTLPWPMDPATAFEIDEPADWTIVESLLRTRTLTEPDRLATFAGRIKLLVSDVDGVLTDGGMYYGHQGDLLKKFNTRDGLGLARWRKQGGRVALVTGEDTPIVSKRAEKLELEYVALGVTDKVAALTKIVDDLALSWEQVAYIGDDLNDLEVMRRVGLSACPSDAAEAVQSVAHVRCRRAGGEGCVREFVDALLKFRGVEEP